MKAVKRLAEAALEVWNDYRKLLKISENQPRNFFLSATVGLCLHLVLGNLARVIQWPKKWPHIISTEGPNCIRCRSRFMHRKAIICSITSGICLWVTADSLYRTIQSRGCAHPYIPFRLKLSDAQLIINLSPQPSAERREQALTSTRWLFHLPSGEKSLF
jgi:hypothetical protein